MDNPIKNNRIVNDMTFAIRLKSFLEEVKVNDSISEEEQSYLIMVAKKLINHQVDTVTEPNEFAYLKNIGLTVL